MTVFVADREPAGEGAWEQPPPQPSANAAPVLTVDGFEGPLDWLLEMAGAQQIDLGKLSILGLVEAFMAALDAAVAGLHGTRADLARWGDWLVMAATLAMLRSRLMLPKDAPEARAAQDEAEALRRLLVGRVAMQRAAAWLDKRPKLGRDVFGRGAGAEDRQATARVADIVDLFRACLVALAVPDQGLDLSGQRRVPFWRVTDAVARITRMLAERPGGAELAAFLPAVDAVAPDQDLRCRAAVASTLLAGLELAREETLRLEQPRPWRAIQIQGAAKPLRDDFAEKLAAEQQGQATARGRVRRRG